MSHGPVTERARCSELRRAARNQQGSAGSSQHARGNELVLFTRFFRSLLDPDPAPSGTARASAGTTGGAGPRGGQGLFHHQ